MTGAETLTTATTLITQDRQGTYGHAAEDFSQTAKLMTVVLDRKGFLKPGAELDAHCVALLMVCVKLSREAHMHKDDSCVDMAGYAALASEVFK